MIWLVVEVDECLVLDSKAHCYCLLLLFGRVSLSLSLERIKLETHSQRIFLLSNIYLLLCDKRIVNTDQSRLWLVGVCDDDDDDDEMHPKKRERREDEAVTLAIKLTPLPSHTLSLSLSHQTKPLPSIKAVHR
jgi:hypothetical protein